MCRFAECAAIAECEGFAQCDRMEPHSGETYTFSRKAAYLAVGLHIYFFILRITPSATPSAAANNTCSVPGSRNVMV